MGVKWIVKRLIFIDLILSIIIGISNNVNENILVSHAGLISALGAIYFISEIKRINN